MGRRLPFLFFCFLTSLHASDVAGTWADLEAKRGQWASFHQEFDITRKYRVGDHTQSSKTSTVVDVGHGQWRQESVSGSGDTVDIFDGEQLFKMETGGGEYVRVKKAAKEVAAGPTIYRFENIEMSKGVEQSRKACGFSTPDHVCVTLEFPIRPHIPKAGDTTSKVTGGASILVFDTVTGLLVGFRTISNIEGRNNYQSDMVCQLKKATYNGPPNEALFRLPAGDLQEVKELPRWDAGRIKRQLAGKPAPDLALTDLKNHAVRLSELKGKTVLLDFWATWCGPCKADAPSIDKLYEKYGEKNLAVIGISVSEDRHVVEEFLKKNPHTYPIALTTENEMPKEYQIGVFPTYIVIDADGTLSSAAEGTKGFHDLRSLLKKAGLEVE